MSKYSLGIDMGGTGIKIGLVDQKGAIIKSARLPTPVAMKPRKVAEHIAERAHALMNWCGRRLVKGAGVGCAGDVNYEKGIIRVSPNLGWTNVPLKRLLTEELKLRVLVDNDANVAAWAAYVVEAKKRVSNLLCVTVGTGIGSGLILDGKLYHGATGTAGEIGHMTLVPDGRPCACGNNGCTERYVGSRAMSEEARQALRDGRKSLVARMVKNDHSQISPLIIQQAALKGDRLARELWQEMGTRLGITLASVVNLLNPQWIVLAGGLSKAGPLLLKPVQRTILKHSFPTPAKAVKLTISRLDQDLGMVGAGLLAHDAFR